MRVRDLMTTPVVVVAPETPLKEVARLLVDHRVSGVPVVGADGRILGVISEADFVRHEGQVGAPHGLPFVRRLLDRAAGDAPRPATQPPITAAEAMSRPARTIGPEEPLRAAAKLMTEARVNRLPVVAEGRVVGILTRADVVRAYARSDAELQAAAEEGVRGVDGLRVVGVQDGVVRLSGTLASRQLLNTVRQVVAAIDGIVAVDDRDVSWEEDHRPEVVPGWTGTEPGMEPGSRSN